LKPVLVIKSGDNNKKLKNNLTGDWYDIFNRKQNPEK
jgi:adenine-specific DNA methylase